MRELVVLSGKGGTGKTSVTAAMAHQAYSDGPYSGSVIVDADVDAANLELVVGSVSSEAHDFSGNDVAHIDIDACLVCGLCQEFCRFDAISFSGEDGFQIDPMGCEGCAACFYQCPVEAIQMVQRVAGRWFRSESRFGTFFHARLHPAQENSGKLVSLVKEKAKNVTREEGSPLMIVDGPPGIACPAIAAVSGADLVLIVTEPTVAGLHDLERAEDLIASFRLPSLVCINKADIHPEGARQIEEHCRERGVRVLGRIPFDESVTQAMAQGQPVTAYLPEAPASLALMGLWEDVKEALGS